MRGTGLLLVTILLLLATAKLAKLIGWLGRLRKTLPTGLLHIVYNSYVLPNFDYACTIWGSVNANTKCI